MTLPVLATDKVALYHSDCLAMLASLPDNSLDALVTDPPAGIGFMGKDWDSDKGGRDGWIAWLASVMAECYRVMKPGAHGLVWALPRTSHWTGMALETAGFEVRDRICHLFGTGFPKSLDVAKAIDKRREDDPRPVCRFLRTAMDARGLSSRQVADAFGFHSRMVDHWAARETDSQPTVPTVEQWEQLRSMLAFGHEMDAELLRLNARKGTLGEAWTTAPVIGEHAGTPGGFGAHRFSVRDNLERTANSADARKWEGWGTALKPAVEDWWLVRKPLQGTVAQNVAKWGTGAINVDGCRIGTTESLNGGAYAKNGTERADGWGTQRAGAGAFQQPAGRWPAHLTLDECFDPVLVLRRSAPLAVKEFFVGYGPVQGVRVADPDFSESGEPNEVLQPGMLRRGPGRPDGRSEAPAVGEAPVGRDQGQDACLAAPGGAREPPVQGVLAVEGVSHTVDGRVDGSGVGAGDSYVARALRRSRASAGDGTAAGSAAAPERSGAPQERNQDGQPAGEPGAAGRLGAQAGALGTAERTSSGAGGDRQVEVLGSDVPDVWAKYFDRTGLAVRGGAAALLDAQSEGKMHSAGKARAGSANPRAASKGHVQIAPQRNTSQMHRLGDSGGASRFFYVAKTSTKERNYGCDDLPVKSKAEATGRDEGSAGINDPRAGAGGGSRNHHPTVKPLALMRWLCRLITPPGGVVLDPFAGSGSTGIAALQEGFGFIGSEASDEYIEITKARLTAAESEL